MITKATSLQEIKKRAPLCSCDQCKHGCTMGSGCFAPSDLAPFAEFMGLSIDECKEIFLEPIEKFHTTLWRPIIHRQERPWGKCIFFNEGNCMINDVKPTECRIAMACSPEGEQLSKWFTLNYFVNTNDPESMKQWATYLKTHTTIPGGQLHELNNLR